MCCHVGCAWNIYVNESAFESRSKKIVWAWSLKGAWHLNEWYIVLVGRCIGWVHGKRCMAFFYTPIGIRKVFV